VVPELLVVAPDEEVVPDEDVVAEEELAALEDDAPDEVFPPELESDPSIPLLVRPLVVVPLLVVAELEPLDAVVVVVPLLVAVALLVKPFELPLVVDDPVPPEDVALPSGLVTVRSWMPATASQPAPTAPAPTSNNAMR
jgi:hypothetical protein